MDVQIWSALIQAVGTVVAAGVAVFGARSALNQWKKEAPGRRRLELADESLQLVEETCHAADVLSWSAHRLFEARRGVYRGAASIDTLYKDVYDDKLKMSDAILRLILKEAHLSAFGIKTLDATELMNAYCGKVLNSADAIASTPEFPTDDESLRVLLSNLGVTDGDYKIVEAVPERKAALDAFILALQPHLTPDQQMK